MAATLSIGEAARRSGCAVATIRFYEEAGLIARAARDRSGRRVFTHADIERLRLIRRLRLMEFGIEAIKQLLSAMRGAGTCLDVRDIAAAQLGIVRQRKAEIDALERTLAGIAGICGAACADGVNPECTIVDALVRA